MPCRRRGKVPRFSAPSKHGRLSPPPVSSRLVRMPRRCHSSGVIRERRMELPERNWGKLCFQNMDVRAGDVSGMGPRCSMSHESAERLSALPCALPACSDAPGMCHSSGVIREQRMELPERNRRGGGVREGVTQRACLERWLSDKDPIPVGRGRAGMPCGGVSEYPRDVLGMSSKCPRNPLEISLNILGVSSVCRTSVGIRLSTRMG